MPSESPLAGLLAEQPEETLAEWLTRLTEQISQLQFERRLVEQALNKRTRRNSRGTARRTNGSAPTAGTGGRFAGIPRRDVFELVREAGQPLTPTEVAIIFRRHGVETGPEPMRTALNRLVHDGLLSRLSPSQFVVAPEYADLDQNEASESLFRTADPQSQGPRGPSVPDGV